MKQNKRNGKYSLKISSSRCSRILAFSSLLCMVLRVSISVDSFAILYGNKRVFYTELRTLLSRSLTLFSLSICQQPFQITFTRHHFFVALSFYYNSVFDGCWSYFYGLFILYSFIRTNRSMRWCSRLYSSTASTEFPMNFRFSQADRSSRIIFPFSNGISRAHSCFFRLYLFSFWRWWTSGSHMCTTYKSKDLEYCYSCGLLLLYHRNKKILSLLLLSSELCVFENRTLTI